MKFQLFSSGCSEAASPIPPRSSIGGSSCAKHPHLLPVRFRAGKLPEQERPNFNRSISSFATLEAV